MKHDHDLMTNFIRIDLKLNINITVQSGMDNLVGCVLSGRHGRNFCKNFRFIEFNRMTILIWNFLELTIISHIVNFTFQDPQLISHSISAIIFAEIAFSIRSNLLNYFLVSILRNFSLTHGSSTYP